MLNTHRFAMNWVDAWNRRDHAALMSHYSDDVQFESPRVAARFQAGGAGSADGRIVGRAALSAYFLEALEATKGLRLDIQDVLLGVKGSFSIVYTRETGAKVVEVFRMDAKGEKVVAVQVFYDLVC